MVVIYVLKNYGSRLFSHCLEYSNEVLSNSGDSLDDIKNIIFKDLKLLLVEDNEINQYVTLELLTSSGIDVDISRNGLEAVEKIKSGNTYDIILMDIHMPVLNGYDAAKIIRNMGIDIPIIAITADAVIGINEKVIDSGMNKCISKPIIPEELIKTICDVTNESKIKKCVNQNKIGKNTNQDEKNIKTGINYEAGLQRVNGKKERYIKVLETFKEQHIKDAMEIKEALSNGEFEKAERIAHTLKGVACIIGAENVSKSAEKIQLLISEIANLI